MSQKQYKIIFISSLAIVVLFLVFFQVQKNILLSKSVITTEANKPSVAHISFTIIAGDTTLRLSSPQGQSLYNALLLAKTNNQITFSGKNYPGLGFFITGIDNLHSGNGKNLFYYINNKEASVGVSSYLLKDGDIIEWKLK